MINFNSSIHSSNNNDCDNKKLYQFLATNYDISTLAYKISAAKNAPSGILNLKKITNGNDITIA